MKPSERSRYATETPYIGCAGWRVSTGSVSPPISDDAKQDTPTACLKIGAESEAPEKKQNSHLERYSALFSAVEINSSFYRHHLPATYTRWRNTVPPDFRFSVKLPRTVTHDLRLKNCHAELGKFLEGVGNLEQALGCLLIQLPPSLGFDARVAQDFFALLQSGSVAPLVLEPRHPDWFKPEVLHLLEQKEVALVHADPRVAGITVQNLPQTAPTAYFRLHGSPSMYHSSYDRHYLESLLQEMVRQFTQGRKVWCIFDNTASGAAFPNALTMDAMWRQNVTQVQSSDR